MLKQVILIIDKRVELSTKYKKILEQMGFTVFCESTIAASLDILTKYEPDLILISDSLEKNIADTCKKIRILSYTFRPVMIALSKSTHMPDKLDTLNSGADDFLSEPIDTDEFKARINAHIRRHTENNVNPVTQLYDAKISFQYLRRLLLTPHENFYAMLVDIDNYEFYREIYGEIAADKMLQTYQAIITSVLEKDDYLGHVGTNDFLIVTKSDKVEKLASYFTYAFDMIAEKFYSNEDISHKYMLLQNDEKDGKPISLVSTSIGIVSNRYKNFTTVKHLMSSLISVLQLAKTDAKSKYIYERPKIASNDIIEQEDYNKNILIIEPDGALAFLLYTAASIQGYNPKILENFDDLFEAIENFTPAVVIIDAGSDNNFVGLNFCKKIKADTSFSKIKIIVTAIVHDKISVLDAGADVYLPKPYELTTIFTWIKKLVSDYNN